MQDRDEGGCRPARDLNLLGAAVAKFMNTLAEQRVANPHEAVHLHRPAGRGLPTGVDHLAHLVVGNRGIQIELPHRSPARQPRC